MTRILENVFVHVTVCFLFALAVVVNGVMGGAVPPLGTGPACPIADHFKTPESGSWLESLSIGPTMPPDPQGVIAIGPTFPPDPEGNRAVPGPLFPPQPWEGDRIAIGPTFPPSPADAQVANS